MKKIIIALISVSITACSSLTEMKAEHRAESRALKSNYKKQIKHITEEFEADNKKLKTKHSLEFGIYVANKIKTLKEFFK